MNDKKDKENKGIINNIITPVYRSLNRQDFRVKFILFAILCGFFIVECRLFCLTKEGKSFAFSFLHRKNRTHNRIDNVINFKRLPIEDRNGKVVARNVMIYDLYLVPSKMIDIKGNLEKIGDIIPDILCKKHIILNKLYKKYTIENATVLLKSGISEIEREKLLDEGILGLYFEESEKRIYPYSEIPFHILGLLSQDGFAVSGIEKELDAYLKTTDNVNPLKLSIDIDVQNFLRAKLIEKVTDTSSKAGVGIIMKIKTGEIISAVSVPDCNINQLQNCTNDMMFNRFSLGTYELGSVFKLLLATLAFENGISPYKKYKREAYRIDDQYTIHDIDNKESIGGEINIIDIVKLSSNVGCAKVIEEIGKDKQKEFFEKIGLLQKLDIELPEIGRTLYPKKWSLANAVTISYGHGIAVTPLHFVSTIASILNTKQIMPTFIYRDSTSFINNNDNIINSSSSEILKDIMRETMQRYVNSEEVRQYDIGGKSGTAIKPINGVYHRDKMILSFIAAAPIADPEYIFFIMLDEPYVTKSNNFLIRGSTVLAKFMTNIIVSSGLLVK